MQDNDSRYKIKIKDFSSYTIDARTLLLVIKGGRGIYIPILVFINTFVPVKVANIYI